MQVNLEDPLKKREQFAVSLRKERSKNIIKQKRMKLLSNLGIVRQQGNLKVSASSM